VARYGLDPKALESEIWQFIPNMTKLENVLRPGRRLAIIMSALTLTTTVSLHAQSIAVPNSSFELQSGVGQQQGVNLNIDSWQRPAKPAYFDAVEENSGIFWIQTAGVFLHGGSYGNAVGDQAAYMFSFPDVGLFQDYNTTDWNDATPTHDFNATYEVGKSYNLTLAVFGKGFSGNMTEGSMLELSLYYRDGTDSMVPVQSTVITYSAAQFPNEAPLNLMDFSVSVPTVQPGDEWANQNIGIQIKSLFGTGDGYWDMDNLRLTAVPEPGTLSLLALGLGGWFCLRRKPRQSA
jgi:hypothetical protein